MDKFEKDIRDFIADRLEEYEGNSYCACDLEIELTMPENMDGAFIIYRDKAMDYIHDNFEYAAKTFDHWKFSTGDAPNPFEDPEAYTFYMLDWGVREILYQCPTVEQNWDEEITLTPETIKQIKREIAETTL